MNEKDKTVLKTLLDNINQGKHPTKMELEDVKDNKEVMISLVTRLPKLLQHCSERLKSDKDVVLATININNIDGSALEYAGENIKNDKECMLSMLKKNCAIFKYASEKLKNDREVVLTAVKLSGGIIIELNEELKNDYEIVKIAIDQTPGYIMYAGGKLKNNKVFILDVLESIENNTNFDQFKKDINKQIFLGNLSKTMLEEISTNDPAKYLKTAIFKENLENTIPQKSNTNKKKNKV